MGVPKNSGCPNLSATYSYLSSGLTSTSYLYPLEEKVLVTGLFLLSFSHSSICLKLTPE